MLFSSSILSYVFSTHLPLPAGAGRWAAFLPLSSAEAMPTALPFRVAYCSGVCGVTEMGALYRRRKEKKQEKHTGSRYQRCVAVLPQLLFVSLFLCFSFRCFGLDIPR